MDVYSAGWDERWLRRFMARLLAFADLAEQAAFRSAPVRWLVLWILRRAEALLEDYIFDVTGELAPTLEGYAAIGNEPADALRLADRFRAMAAMLGAWLGLVSWFYERAGRRPARRSLAFAFVTPASGRLPGCWMPKLNDTS